jgi:hypothetical protein
LQHARRAVADALGFSNTLQVRKEGTQRFSVVLIERDLLDFFRHETLDANPAVSAAPYLIENQPNTPETAG